MAVMVVLVGSLLVFRALGALGVRRFASWKEATRHALAVMFLFTASAHFTPMRHEMARMVPEGVPHPEVVILFTGVCEVLGAVGLLVPGVQRLAGIALVVFLVAVFPANVKAAREGVALGGRAATPLVARLPMQVLFIGLVLWVTQTRRVPPSGGGAAAISPPAAR
jgi:uncharacterized membrane protein